MHGHSTTALVSSRFSHRLESTLRLHWHSVYCAEDAGRLQGMAQTDQSLGSDAFQPVVFHYDVSWHLITMATKKAR